jgi:hypothetical protein
MPEQFTRPAGVNSHYHYSSSIIFDALRFAESTTRTFLFGGPPGICVADRVPDLDLGSLLPTNMRSLSVESSSLFAADNMQFERLLNRPSRAGD